MIKKFKYKCRVHVAPCHCHKINISAGREPQVISRQRYRPQSMIIENKDMKKKYSSSQVGRLAHYYELQYNDCREEKFLTHL